MRWLLLLPLLALAAAAEAGDLPEPIADADYMTTTPEAVALGRLLFYDPLLSWPRRLRPETCRSPSPMPTT